MIADSSGAHAKRSSTEHGSVAASEAHILIGALLSVRLESVRFAARRPSRPSAARHGRCHTPCHRRWRRVSPTRGRGTYGRYVASHRRNRFPPRGLNARVRSIRVHGPKTLRLANERAGAARTRVLGGSLRSPVPDTVYGSISTYGRLRDRETRVREREQGMLRAAAARPVFRAEHVLTPHVGLVLASSPAHPRCVDDRPRTQR